MNTFDFDKFENELCALRKPHIGLHSIRLSKEANNPREVAFAQQWAKEQAQCYILRHLLGKYSNRDAEVAATVIQWLGSNIGMSFIREAMKREKSIKDWLVG